MENFNIRHRALPQRHYTRTSHVLLFGYRGVSDGAKLTYQVIDSFDWTSRKGERKGFAFVSLGRIAELRATCVRTVRRHLAELEHHGLLTRQERPGRSSLLLIEDPSAEQAERYLGDLDNNRVLTDEPSEAPDSSVRPPGTQMSTPSIQGMQREKVKDNVEQALVEERRGEGSDSTHISTTLHRRVAELRAKRAAAADQRAEVLADEICDALGDWKSRTYFRALARTVPAGRIYDALGEVKEAWRGGRVSRSRGAMFVDVLQRNLGTRKLTTQATADSVEAVERLHT